MFSNQRKESGMVGLVGLAAIMVAWVAVAALMIGAYSNPQVRPTPGCEVVCRIAANVPAHG